MTSNITDRSSEEERIVGKVQSEDISPKVVTWKERKPVIDPEERHNRKKRPEGPPHTQKAIGGQTNWGKRDRGRAETGEAAGVGAGTHTQSQWQSNDQRR